MSVKCELYNDNFQNFKKYGIPKAQLVICDPCAGSGSSLRAAMELGRNSYGFEIDRKMCKRAREEMIEPYQAQYNLFDALGL